MTERQIMVSIKKEDRRFHIDWGHSTNKSMKTFVVEGFDKPAFIEHKKNAKFFTIRITGKNEQTGFGMNLFSAKAKSYEEAIDKAIAAGF